MADFNIRSESVDVEQIMKQIRSRIREKRGVDYTEEQIRELATVRLEKFLDPKNLRSDLLEQFRRSRPAIPSEAAPIDPPYEFHDQTLFETHRGALRFIRKLLQPILKLFFNPNPLINVLHAQAQFNVDLLKREQRRKIEFDRSRGEWNALYYEVLHNLVLETTRGGIEIKNLKMRVEALTSRLDFSERRVRALEGVVQYRPDALRRHERADREPDQRVSQPEISADGTGAADADLGATGQLAPAAEGGKRRRRRRRGRRGSVAASPVPLNDEDAGEPAADGPEDASDDVGMPQEPDAQSEGQRTAVEQPGNDAEEQPSPPDDRRTAGGEDSEDTTPAKPRDHDEQ